MQTDLLGHLPATICELLPALSKDRDARVVRVYGDLACIEMDDCGQGEFSRICSAEVAAELVNMGICRDAR